jgi:hypothetical protein
MKEIISSMLKNFSFWDWFLGGLAFLLLSSILIFLLRRFFAIFNAIYVSRKILKRNRKTMGNGYGSRGADVFIEIWFQERNANSTISEAFASGNTIGSSKITFMQVVNNKLIPLGLAEIFEDHSMGIKKVKAIKNFRNKMVLKFTKFFLINIIGDDASYYKNLSK